MITHLDHTRNASAPMGKYTAISFTKTELNAIISLYSTQVMRGVWRDYAMDFTKQMAVFSIFRHTHETPLVAVIKLPSNTTTGYVFEVLYDRKRLSRTPFLDKALQALYDVVD